MRPLLLLAAVLLCLAALPRGACRPDASGCAKAPGAGLVPAPASLAVGPPCAPLLKPVRVVAAGRTSPDLALALARFEARLNGEQLLEAAAAAADASDGATVVRVVVTQDASPTSAANVRALAFDTKAEAYSLAIHQNATVTAGTYWGALRGLETLARLAEEQHLEALPTGAVDDAPRFAWRGLLVDSARHFLPLAAIRRTVDAMAVAKLNVLHWHLVDAQSFPLEVDAMPDLAGCGAYGPDERYSRADVRGLVEYAWMRGVRVVAEADTPGHAASWGTCTPDLVASCPEHAKNVNNVPLDPTSGAASEAAAEVLAQLAEDTAPPGAKAAAVLHLGGDEVSEGCLEEAPSVRRWLADNPGKTIQDLLQGFEERTLAATAAAGAAPALWEEVLDWYGTGSLPKDAVVVAWRSTRALANATAAGLRAVAAFPYYLDRTAPACDALAKSCAATTYAIADTLRLMYEADPLASMEGTPKRQKALVLGGQAAMWGEHVDDGVLDGWVWPRAAAVAERLWSPAARCTDVEDIKSRLASHTCLLKAMGLTPWPVAPGPPCRGGAP